MTTNLQLLTTEPKKLKQREKQSKQTTRTGTESQKWRSREGLSGGSGKGREREELQRISSINFKQKIDGGGQELYRKCRRQRTYMYKPWT